MKFLVILATLAVAGAWGYAMSQVVTDQAASLILSGIGGFAIGTVGFRLAAELD